MTIGLAMGAKNLKEKQRTEDSPTFPYIWSNNKTGTAIPI